MSSSEEDSDGPKRKKIEPMPEYKMRFTDMPYDLVEKAIRSKFYS